MQLKLDEIKKLSNEAQSASLLNQAAILKQVISLQNALFHELILAVNTHEMKITILQKSVILNAGDRRVNRGE